jgi:hypothetical protein
VVGHRRRPRRRSGPSRPPGGGGGHRRRLRGDKQPHPAERLECATPRQDPPSTVAACIK